MIPDRAFLRKLNIYDLNISPINLKALIRRVPLANVYNYSFTFDSLTQKDNFMNIYFTNLLNKNREISDEVKQDMIIYPLNDDFMRIITGNRFGYNRPRFLHDQISYKVSFLTHIGLLESKKSDSGIYTTPNSSFSHEFPEEISDNFLQEQIIKFIHAGVVRTNSSLNRNIMNFIMYKGFRHESKIACKSYSRGPPFPH